MKHVTTLLAILMSGSLLAQSEYCGVGTVWDAETQTCIAVENVELLDSNLDGVIGVEDLLNLLSHFGDEDMDFDGIYDSVDDCVGAYDECGVCNGPGPQILGIDTIIVYYDSLYNEAIDEWWVFAVDSDTLLTYLCENPGCTDSNACNYDASATDDDGSCTYATAGFNCDGSCLFDDDQDGVCDQDEVTGCQDATACNYREAATDPGIACVYATACEMCSGETDGTGVVVSFDVVFDGYTYDLVAIGDQCWFAENLRTEHYANGDAIPANLTDSEWFDAYYFPLDAVAVYGEDGGCEHYSPDGYACDPAWSLNEYGRLYNWYAVDDERGLCPSGWHVPTDSEWIVMTDFLGGSSVAGDAMKTTYGWLEGGNGTNSSGFSGLPGGARNDDGYFYGAGAIGYWWSSSPSGTIGWTTGAWGRYLHYNNSSVNRDHFIPGLGYSVRCLKD